MILAEPNGSNSAFIELPEPGLVDLQVEDLMSLVARTSNTYGRIARFAGMARANYKLAEGRYKRKYKQGLGQSQGRNKESREADAVAYANDEAVELDALESILELAEAQETAARIASESARKLLDKVQAILMAARREGAGHPKESDYRLA